MTDLERAVRRLQEGDPSALLPLYSAYAESAIRTAFLITRNRAAAEDAVHEAFIQVMRSISSLRDPAAFRPWFYRIVVNRAKRLSRRSRLPLPFANEAHDQVDSVTLSPDEVVTGAEEIEAIRQAIATLNESHREVIILRYYSELAEADIAHVLGVPVGTVKSRLHRAKQVLQERLGADAPRPIHLKADVVSDGTQGGETR